MFTHQAGPAAAEDRPKHQRNDDYVVQVPDHRDEVRNEIEWQREVADRSDEQQLAASREAFAGQKAPEEDDTVGNEPGEGVSVMPSPGEQQRPDE
jgi:hypothetical protein